MQHGIHFISGLPRSGSTLLAGILRQNPRFHAHISSPVHHLYSTMLAATSRKHETAPLIDAAQKRALLSGVFDGYYHALHRHKLVFDTNRGWCARMPALAELFPDAKLICCVRPIGWIMDSIERIARKNPFELSSLFGFDAGSTVYSRIQRVAASEGLVGFALDALREAYYGEHAERLLLVDYEALAREPAQTLARIYAFLGEPAFAHDFENVELSADEFDLPLGAPGLHAVGRRVRFEARPTVLPPELFARFERDAFWLRESSPYGASVVTLRSLAETSSQRAAV
ncbi:MAG TPA: sulfotransferase [Polyangiales bacterium]|nr:sulfotransferase [Polyangiales bacterium]